MWRLSLSNEFDLYNPDEFDLSDNNNILQVSEIHAFEERGRQRSRYCRNIGIQIDKYCESYNADEVWILGDTGTFDDLYETLDNIEQDVDVRIIAGDEDKVINKNGIDEDEASKDVLKRAREGRKDGWMQQIGSCSPFDIDLNYKIYDEGFEIEIEGYTIQAAHHPTDEQRDNILMDPDPRNDDILNQFFSVRKDSNESTLDNPYSLSEPDIVNYDHVHMPYSRSFEDTVIHGLGGRRNNHLVSMECMPNRSMHLLSLEQDKVHTLHFDAEDNGIFEHLLYHREEDGNYQRYDVPTPRGSNYSSMYKSLQSRFLKNHIREEAHENDDQLPPLWPNSK